LLRAAAPATREPFPFFRAGLIVVGFQQRSVDERIEPVACRGCGGAMKLACKLSKVGQLPEIRVFICTPCCEVTATEL
jgi:hypothetical protein